MANFLTIDDVKDECGVTHNDDDSLIQRMINAVENLLDEMTGRAFYTGTRTEYYDADDHSDMVFLKNRPVASIATIHDDPDWAYGSGDLIPTADYTFDPDRGIVYYDGYFYQGKRNIKVVYVAGYAATALPASIKEILIRQSSVWYKQAKGQDWHLTSKGFPAGAGSVSLKDLKNNLLPEFVDLVERETL